MRYEYKVVDAGIVISHGGLEAILNDEARDGWEYCDTLAIVTAKWLVFKRELPKAG